MHSHMFEREIFITCFESIWKQQKLNSRGNLEPEAFDDFIHQVVKEVIGHKVSQHDIEKHF